MFEIRILPVALYPAPSVEAAEFFESLLRWCCNTTAVRETAPANLPNLIKALKLPTVAEHAWVARCGATNER